MEINEKSNSNFTEKAERDYQLVKLAVNNGDRKAYTQLMDYYRDTVYFMLLKMTNNNDDAEDLTIETFGKAFNKLKLYSPEFAFSTWLFRIASNNCIDFIRKRKIDVLRYEKDYHEELETDNAAKISDIEPDPEESLIRKQKMDIMHDIVDKLKPRYKKLIELRYFQEYSYEEISEELNLPIGTVKAQLFRAKDFLYNLLKDSDLKFTD